MQTQNKLTGSHVPPSEMWSFCHCKGCTAQIHIDIYIDYFGLEKFKIKYIFCQLCGKIHLRKQNPIEDLKIGGQKWNILRIQYMEIGLLDLWSWFNVLGTGDGSGGLLVQTLSQRLQFRWDSLQHNKINVNTFGPEAVVCICFFDHVVAFLCMRGDRLTPETKVLNCRPLITQLLERFKWGAARRGEIIAVPRKIKRFPFSVGIPVIAQRIQMLKQHVPCNLVIALWAVTEIRASTGNEEPQCLCVTRLGFNVFLFIYLFHSA